MHYRLNASLRRHATHVAAALVLAAATPAAAAPGTPAAGAVVGAFVVLTSDRLGGAGGWDYLTLDAAGRRLYITRGDHVDVYDTEAARVVGRIPDTAGVHGVALAEGRQRGYTSNGRAGSVSIFDTQTLKVVRELAIPGQNPDAIVYEPRSERIFTFNGKSQDVTVIDAASEAVVATLRVPGKPEFAVTDGEGRVYANIETEPGQLVVIDARTSALKATWPLPGCNSPTGLAIDTAQHRLFSVCDGRVMVVTDATTGRQLARVPIGDGPDGAAYDPALGLVFSSNGEGTLSIVRAETQARYTVSQTLATVRGARTMALDPKSHRIYLVTADLGPAPPPTAEAPHPRPVQVPDTFTLHVVGMR